MAANVKALLFDRLRESGLLEPGQLEELAKLPEAKDPDPRGLAKQVLRRGWLTRFQLNLVAQGKAAELSVGPYVLLDRLGEGGMGQVFKARHRHMHRVVALKVIRKDRLKSPEAVQRFYQEVQAAAHLSHPNIVLAYDADQVGTTHYLSMEFVDGHDLARIVKERGPLPVAVACDYVRQAALGLQHAHERGMVHRDIKPHNLLVAAAPPGERASPRWGVVKILDMGLARLQQGVGDQERGLTQTGAVIGTPDFLAPEQALNSRAADIRSDLYSLGCTLYFLLAGRAPFHADSLTQLLLKHQMEEPTPLEQLRPDVPAGLAALVGCLLAKRPEDRVQTPAELAAALEPFCGGEAGAVPPPRAVVPAAEDAWTALAEEGPDAAMAPSPGARTVTLEDARGPRKKASARGRSGAEATGRSRFLLLGGIGAGAFLFLLALVVGGVVLWAASLKPRPPAPPAPGPLADSGNPPPVPTVRPAPAPSPRERPPAVQPVPEPPPPPPPQPQQTPPPPPDMPPAAGEVRRQEPGDLAVVRLVFSPDGRRLAGCDNIKAYVWDVESGRLLKRLAGPPVMTQTLAWCPDSRRLFLGGQGNNVLQLWDTEDGKLLHEYRGHTAVIHSVAVSPDGHRGFSCSGDVEVQDGKPVRKDNRLVYKDPTVRAWDLETGQELYHFDGHTELVSQVTLSADGRRALSRSRDALCLWDTDRGREIRRLAERNGQKFQVSAAVLCPDGRQALLGIFNQGLVLWDVEADQEVRRFESYPGQLDGLVVSADGRLALSSSHQFDQEQKKVTDVTVRLWEVSSGRQLHHFEGHREMAWGLAFAPDNRLAASSSWDRTARLWDLSVAGPTAVRPPEKAPGGSRSTTPPKAAVKKEAVPSREAQAEAEKLVKKQEAEAKKPAERAELARKFLEKARATNDDPDGRYVLLREARDLAAQVADPVTALQAADQIAQLYDTDAPLDMKLAALATAAKAATTTAAEKAVVESALAVLEDTVAADNYKAAGELLRLAEAAARKGPQGLLPRVEARAKEVREAEKDYDGYEMARAKLKDEPGAKDANLTAGKYLCFRKGDWDAGLPLLAKGDDKALQELAEADLARPSGVADQVKAGDGWWGLAEDKEKSKLGKTQLQLRACYWYQQAVTGASGLTRDKIEERIKQVQEQVADLKAAETAGEGRLFSGHSAKVTGVAFLADGKRIISAGQDRKLRLWDVQSGKELHAFDLPAPATCVAVASGTNSIGAGTTGGQFQIWDADTQKSIGFKFGPGTSNSVGGAAFAPDEHRVALGNQTGLIIWNENNGSTHTDSKWTGITAMAAAKGGNYLLLGFSDGAVRLWNVDTSRQERQWVAQNGAVLGVALFKDKDGRLYAATAGADKTAHLWDVLTAQEKHRFRGHTGQVLGIAISPDGRFVVTGSEDQTVRLWDARTGRELRRFTGHTEAVTSVAFSPDGHQVLSGSEDKSVRLWDLAKPAAP
jgi:WD40 repeat protein/tRNA A-37 threonylcarbamoyl transferase component Bud32